MFNVLISEDYNDHRIQSFASRAEALAYIDKLRKAAPPNRTYYVIDQPELPDAHVKVREAQRGE